MVRTDTEVYHVGFLYAEAIFSGIIVDELGDAVCLANRNDGGLWAQNGGHEVASTDVAHARHAESAIVEVGLGQPTCARLIRQVLQLGVYLDDALLLHALDVGHSQPVRTVDRNAEVMIMLHHVALDVALAVQIVVDVRVHHRMLVHCDRDRLDEEGEHCQVSVHLFHFLAKCDQGCSVHLV